MSSETNDESTTDRFYSPRLPTLARGAVAAVSSLAPGLTASLGERLFLRTRRHPVPRRERRVVEAADRRTVETLHGPVPAWLWPAAADREADAPTALLVHGWEGRGAQLGDFVAPLGERGWRVVAFDAPGHGEAAGRSSSLVAMADALAAVAARWAPRAIVAHSAGAIPATFVVSRGLAVDRLVFVAPGAGLVAYSRQFAEWIGLSERARRLLQERIERRIGASWRELEPLELAPRMEVPLLVVSDRRDRESPLATVEALAGAWPGARLEVTEGLGHRRILRDPRVIDRAVDFLGAPEPWRAAPATAETTLSGGAR